MPHDGWKVEGAAGVTLVRCCAIDSLCGIAHAFSTRLDGEGEDGFDLGEAAGAAALDRRRALCAAAGALTEDVTVVRQVHGAVVVRADRAAAARRGPLAADGVVALRSDRLTPAVRWADCVPLLLADRSGEAVAAVHAGWRGVAAGVVGSAVALLGTHGVLPSTLVAAIGPAIGPCCYQVGEEVHDAIAGSRGSRPGRLDLPGAVAGQLRQAGLSAAAVHAAPWCTSCDRDLFYSHRRSGRSAGRQLACIGWRE